MSSKPAPGVSVFKALLVLALLGLLAAAAAGAWAHREYRAFAAVALSGEEESRIVEIAPGDGFVRVLGRLRAAGFTEGHDWQWRVLAHELDVAGRLQVGEYELGRGASATEVLRTLASGRVVHYRFTIIEGMSLRQLRAALAAEPRLAQDGAALDEAALMEAVGAPGVLAEGRFLPDTYHFTRGMSDLDVLRRARAAMDVELARVWALRHDDLPLRTPEEALVMASIIEKETGQAGERHEISGVFARRLRIGMRLQTDPTVIYGMGEAYDGNIRRSDLTTDTPWNTYTRAGLPPTPIAMPGRAALLAAVQPADGDALYFVARGDGSHVFSRTLAEHNAAVRRWQLGR